VAGDFNGDGKLDLAVVDFPNDVSVLLGHGDGTFQQGGKYPVGLFPNSMVAGDFNGDGRVDLAFANSADNTVSVLLGNGDGSFQPAQAYPAGQAPVALVAGDFNGDGKLDLAAVDDGQWYGGTSMVAVLLGNGDGTFQRARQSSLEESAASSIVAGDFNGDGHFDLAVAGADTHNTGDVSVLLGHGDGTFKPGETYILGVEGYIGDYPGLVAGDFNGDGRTDLATANPGSNDVSVLLGNGDGTFQAEVRYAAESYPHSLVAGDFNGDGHLDLALANGNGVIDLAGYPGAVSVLLGNGGGTFQPARQYAVGPSPLSMVADDFNGDGRMDLVAANQNTNNLSVFLGNGDGTFGGVRK
jgi:hypothetical protein